jgi:hypothetical protein
MQLICFLNFELTLVVGCWGELVLTTPEALFISYIVMKKRLRESKILDPLQWKSDASDDNVISILNKKVKVVASPSDNHSQIRNQRSILIVLFRDLDNVLNEFHRKGRTAFWVHIKPAIECCTNGRIALDDVACLIAIDPSAYSLTWQLNNSSCSSSKYELCLSFGVPSRGKSLQAESRLQAFRFDCLYQQITYFWC